MQNSLKKMFVVLVDFNSIINRRRSRFRFRFRFPRRRFFFLFSLFFFFFFFIVDVHRDCHRAFS